MGAQDENNAEPQNEFLSGFKIKPQVPSQEKKEKSFGANDEENSSDFVSQKIQAGLRNSSSANPYQLTEQKGMSNHSNDIFGENESKGFIKKLKGIISKEDSGTGGARQKAMVVLIPVLFVIMIFMYRQVLSKSPQNSQGASNEDIAVSSVNNIDDNEINWEIPDPLPIKEKNPSGNNQEMNDGGNQNGEIYASEDSDVINVKSIVYSDDKSSVVIGNKIVYINQEINGITIREIHKDYIVYEKDGVKLTQKIAEELLNESWDKNNQGSTK